MAAEMKVTEAAVEAALAAFNSVGELLSPGVASPSLVRSEAMGAALQAALTELLEPVGCMHAEVAERLKRSDSEECWCLDMQQDNDITLYRIRGQE